MTISPYVAEAAKRANRDFSDDEIRVIRERYHGWEKASPKLLARVFGVSVQKITRIVNEGRPCL